MFEPNVVCGPTKTNVKEYPVNSIYSQNSNLGKEENKTNI